MKLRNDKGEGRTLDLTLKIHPEILKRVQLDCMRHNISPGLLLESALVVYWRVLDARDELAEEERKEEELKPWYECPPLTRKRKKELDQLIKYQKRPSAKVKDEIEHAK